LKRPSWDELFIATAVLGSSRGTCDRLRTSCLLVKDNKMVGAGYNGAVAGLKNCDEVGHLIIDNHCLRTLHGEQNALANAQCDLHGSTAYVIGTPCIGCVKELLQHGVTRIVYVGEYGNAAGAKYIKKLCREKKVTLNQFLCNPLDVAKIFEKIFVRLEGPGGIFSTLDVSWALIKRDKMEGK
jgi:dCMP deaminase